MKSRIGALAAPRRSRSRAPSAVGGTGHRQPARRRRRPRRSSRARSRTDGHQIEQDKNGPQPCDGTNGGANPTRRPDRHDARWTTRSPGTAPGTTSFSDFLVNRIGPDKATDTQFWGTALNGTPTELGGCQVQVKTGRRGPLGLRHVRRQAVPGADRPADRELDKPFRVKVTDAKNGNAPVKGATVSRRRARPTPRASRRSSAEERGLLLVKAERRGRDPLQRAGGPCPLDRITRAGRPRRRRSLVAAAPAGAAAPVVDQMVVFKDGSGEDRQGARVAPRA